MLNSLLSSIETPPPLRSPFSLFPSTLLGKHQKPHSLVQHFNLKPSTPLSSNHITLQWRITACAADSEIDMVRTKEGVYAAKPKKVVILWDLDNKPPRGPPYEAAMALKRVAQNFGEVVEVSAYANRHAFIHLPNWVVEERRERRRLDILERKGLVSPSELYVCSVCGRKLKTNLDLKKHFKQLHERERNKKLSRMRALKGKKRQRFKERFIDGNEKYNEAARSLLKPKVGYGLAQELRRAGVYVKTVEDKPQAADWALKKQMQHSMSRGIDWLFLISDDSDFSEMLKKAREADLGTVVVGDWDRALGRHADIWVPWNEVENGTISEKDLMSMLQRRRGEESSEISGNFSFSEFGGMISGEENLDGEVDELVERMEFSGMRISAFSEGEEQEDEEDEEDWLRLRLEQRGNIRLRGRKSVNSDEEWDDHEDDDVDGLGDYLLDSEDEVEEARSIF